MSQVLQGVRVLDFGRYIAGPYCAALLGDLGAEVIRIDRVRGSEDRYYMPLAGEGSDGAMYLQMNRNKRGMTLNLNSDEGRVIRDQLVATADVVVANLPDSALRALGLDEDSLRKIRPDVILTTVSAYGPGGPLSNEVGFDGIGQVMSGAAWCSGRPGEPWRAAAPWVDFGTASLCAFGTLAALIERRRSGRGQQVQGALLNTALTFFNPMLIEQAVTGSDREPTGNRGQFTAPTDIFPTRDGWIIAQCVGPGLFKRWTRLVGEEGWFDDSRFATDQDRGDHGELVSERMREWCASRTSAEAVQALNEARIPASPVNSPQQALDDEHIRATGFLGTVEHPGLPAAAPISRTPVKLSETPGELTRRAPTLGEHTDAILGELGYDEAAVAGLRERGVV